MLTDEVMELLDSPCGVYLGTRNAELVPHTHRVWGIRSSEDRRLVTVLMSRVFAGPLESSLVDNGRVTLTVSRFTDFKTFQLKGRHLETREVDDDDISLYERTRSMCADAMSQMGFPADVSRRIVARPDIAVTFEVEAIFCQTPGKGAGRRYGEKA